MNSIEFNSFTEAMKERELGKRSILACVTTVTEKKGKTIRRKFMALLSCNPASYTNAIEKVTGARPYTSLPMGTRWLTKGLTLVNEKKNQSYLRVRVIRYLLTEEDGESIDSPTINKGEIVIRNYKLQNIESIRTLGNQWN